MSGRTVGAATGYSAAVAVLCFIFIWPIFNAALAANGKVPVPRPKPDIGLAGQQATPGQAVSQVLNDRGEQGVDRQATTADTAANSCYRAFKAIAPGARREQSFRNATGCGMPDPVVFDVVATQESEVVLSGEPMLSCRFARTFATWISDVVAPLARQHMGANLTRIHVGPGYNCRTRNRVKGAKLSEHSFGTAIDMVSFTLADKRKIAIGSKNTVNARRFLRAVRTTACGYFTTVLGPGSNAAHKSHFHVDIGKHGRTGHYRICE